MGSPGSLVTGRADVVSASLIGIAFRFGIVLFNNAVLALVVAVMVEATVSVDGIEIGDWLEVGTKTGAVRVRVEVCPKTKGVAVADRVVVEGVPVPGGRGGLEGPPGGKRVPLAPIGAVTDKGRGPLPVRMVFAPRAES